MFTFGSLFSGIGGIDLGLERAGMHCEWQVEIDEYAQKVLAKHWPNVARYGDIRECGSYLPEWDARWPHIRRGDQPTRKHVLSPVDLIAGGFPCQPHSFAGSRKAGADERNLWPEFHRIIRELKPRWIMAENVLGILSSERGRFFGDILRDLAREGYDAEWEVLRASDFGLPHIRKRVFLLAYPMRERRTRLLCNGPRVRAETSAREKATPLDSVWSRLTQFEQSTGESSVLGSNDGLPSWMDRLERIGNAVVPQVAEYVGNLIMEANHARLE